MEVRRELGRAGVDELVRMWDAQQAAYIAHREFRFEAMLDVIDGVVADAEVVVLDLACGPGSLTIRLLERFKNARVIGVDFDPVLVEVARHAVAPYGDRAQIVDADLTDSRWVATLDGVEVSVAVSTTALHWLSATELLDLYHRLGQVLPPGGLLLNGDHLPFDDRSPTFHGLAKRHDAQTQAAAFASGALTWDQWWEAAMLVPELAAARTLRDERFAARAVSPPTTPEFHMAALRQAGFAEVATVWQHLDDYVVAGRR